MRRTLLVLVVAAISCGGKSKPPTTPLPPDTKTEPDKPDTADKPADKPAEPPPAPAGPIDIAVEAPKTTVKLVSPGKGKRTALKLTPKVGAKQQVEIVFDGSEHQSAPAELGGDTDNPFPSIVLIGDSEVKAVDPTGKADYVVTISGTDVRDPTSKMPAATLEQLKGAISSIQGMTLSSSIDANGTQSAVKVHVDKPKAETQKVLDQLLELGLPAWPLLPSDPVAVGAKWQVTRSTKLVGKVDATYTTDYELSARSGATATIKGTTKVSGSDQDVGPAKLQKLGGAGDVEIALADGALYPKLAQHDETKFEVVVSGKDDTGATKSGTISINFKQAVQITPK